LMQASRRGNAAAVKCLVVRGADMTITDRFGDTALELAEDARVKAMLTAGLACLCCLKLLIFLLLMQLLL
jgi:predicted Fe-Mo cluster-binding NifX family protein